MRKVTFYVEDPEDGQPLGALLRRRLPAVPRGKWKSLLGRGDVKLGGKVTRQGDRPARRGQSVEARIPGNLGNSPLDFELAPRRILRREEGWLVVDKPASVKCHRNHPGETTTTMREAVAAAVGVPADDLHLVHRLDRGTSGALLFALDPEVSRHLGRQFARKTVGKRYMAVVEGRLEPTEGTVDAPLRRAKGRAYVDPARGKPSVTRYRVLGRAREHSLVELHPETGRTHQIRAHMAHLGHPLAGDLLYGARLGIAPREERPLDLGGPLLHCAALEFATGQGGERVAVEAPPPGHFRAALKRAGLDPRGGGGGEGEVSPGRGRGARRSARGRSRRTPRRGRRAPPRRRR